LWGNINSETADNNEHWRRLFTGQCIYAMNLCRSQPTIYFLHYIIILYNIYSIQYTLGFIYLLRSFYSFIPSIFIFQRLPNYYEWYYFIRIRRIFDGLCSDDEVVSSCPKYLISEDIRMTLQHRSTLYTLNLRWHNEGIFTR